MFTNFTNLQALPLKACIYDEQVLLRSTLTPGDDDDDDDDGGGGVG